jgi:hypothetical protein
MHRKIFFANVYGSHAPFLLEAISWFNLSLWIAASENGKASDTMNPKQEKKAKTL